MIGSPKSDRIIGIDYFVTNAPGCGGVLRQKADDFLVEEVYEDASYEGGRYLIVDLEKSNWDTHHLVREISRRLGISQRRFGWAGTKDKHAVTRQRLAILNLDESALEKISLPGVKMKVLGRSNRGISLGDLIGNRFEVRIRDLAIETETALDCVNQITGEISDFGGLPNYFGVQRFGEVRPVTHLVGEALVRGDVEGAVFTYLAMFFPGEPEATYAVRKALWETHDVGQALKEYPMYLRYERAMLDYLHRNEGDFAGAFDVLAPNLKRLFVHAYQSYIFNKILSHRLASGMPLGKALPGDVICFGKDGLPDASRLQDVTPENVQAVNRLFERNRAFLTLPLFGFESEFAEGLQGEIERKVLEEEGVEPAHFKIGENPDLGSRGVRRPALLAVSPQTHLEDDGTLLLKFFLPKGSYATVVLREYMK
jgi:tRNA pseudouridine13 synthase